MNKQTKLAIAAVALLVLAGAIFIVNFKNSSSANFKEPPTKADIEKQIADIQNNTHMPEQAKAAAIGQIRARSQGFGAPVRQQ